MHLQQPSGRLRDPFAADGHRAGKRKSGDRHAAPGAKAGLIRVGTFGGADFFCAGRSACLNLSAPVRIADFTVFGELVLARRGNGLEERPVRSLHANQEVRSEQAFIQQATLILAEIVVVARFEYSIAFEAGPGDQGHLLRIEIRRQILMRKMNAVIPGRVIPAAAHIDKPAAVGQTQMCICAVDVASGALALKVKNNVGQGVSLQNILVD